MQHLEDRPLQFSRCRDYTGLVVEQDLLAEHITARDAEVLQYLEDVRFRQAKDAKSAAVELVFRPNSCMTDHIVSHSVRVMGGVLS